MKKILAFILLLLPSLAKAELGGIITFPEGSNGEVQYESDGYFAGSSSFTFSTSTYQLTVPKVRVTSIVFTMDGSTLTTASSVGGAADGTGGWTHTLNYSHTTNYVFIGTTSSSARKLFVVSTAATLVESVSSYPGDSWTGGRIGPLGYLTTWQPSGSSLPGDYIALVNANFKDSNNTMQEFGEIGVLLTTPTAASESAKFTFSLRGGGDTIVGQSIFSIEPYGTTGAILRFGDGESITETQPNTGGGFLHSNGNSNASFSAGAHYYSGENWKSYVDKPSVIRLGVGDAGVIKMAVDNNIVSGSTYTPTTRFEVNQELVQALNYQDKTTFRIGNISTGTNVTFSMSPSSSAISGVLMTAYDDGSGQSLLRMETGGSGTLWLSQNQFVGIATGNPGGLLEIHAKNTTAPSAFMLAVSSFGGPTGGILGVLGDGSIIINHTTYTWPNGGESSGEYLMTNGSGGLSWSPGGGSAASTLQVKDGGVEVSSPTESIDFDGVQFVGTESPTGEANISLDPSTVTLLGPNPPASSIASGSLGASVLASSVAAGSFQSAISAGSNITVTPTDAGVQIAASGGSADGTGGWTQGSDLSYTTSSVSVGAGTANGYKAYFAGTIGTTGSFTMAGASTYTMNTSANGELARFQSTSGSSYLRLDTPAGANQSGLRIYAGGSEAGELGYDTVTGVNTTGFFWEVNTAEKMRLTNQGIGVFQGNPTANFEVKSSTTGTNYVMKISSQNGVAMLGVLNDGRFNFAGSTWSWMPSYGTAGQVIVGDGNGGLAFGTVTSTITGGGGGSSALGVATGTSSGYNGEISTPTTVILFNSAQFIGAPQGGATAYLRLDPSSVTLLGANPPASSIASGSLGSGVISSSHSLNSIYPGNMADADHGDVSWSGNTATVDNVAAANVAAGNLGASVKASSVAAQSFQSAITAGTNVTVTPTDAGVQISASAGASTTWTENNGQPVYLTTDAWNVAIGTVTLNGGKLTVVSSTTQSAIYVYAEGVTDNPVMDMYGPESTSLSTGKVLGVATIGDSYSRLMSYTDGKFGWGSGNNDRDVFLYRNAAHTLTLSSDAANGTANFAITGDLTVGGTCTGCGGGAADNLGNHVATTAVNMAGFAVYNTSGVSVSGSGPMSFTATNSSMTFSVNDSATPSMVLWTSSASIGSDGGEIRVATLTANGVTRYLLPAADGSPNQVLQTNGSGVLSWATGGGGGTGMQNPATSTLNMAGYGLINVASVSFNQAQQPAIITTQPTFGVAVNAASDIPQYNLYQSSFVFASSGTFGGNTTVNGTMAATTFSGSGASLTSIPTSAIANGTLADGVKVTTGNVAASGTASGTTYLRGDGSWSTPAGGGSSSLATATGSASGFTGTVSSPTAVLNYDTNGFVLSPTGGATTYISLDATLLDLAVAPLGEADSVSVGAIAAGTLPTDVLASSVAVTAYASDNAIRTNLGLAIGTDVEAWDADLDDLADGSLTGSKVGSGVPAANIASGSLGASVLASSVAAQSFQAAVSAGANITITPTDAGIQIAASGGGGSGIQNPATSTINMDGYGLINVASVSFNQAQQPVLITTHPSFGISVNRASDIPQYNFYSSSFVFASSGTFGGTATFTDPIADASISDTITVGASGSVNDSALSANVTKLGATITMDEVGGGAAGANAYDLGGATSLEIPNGSGPTVDATGEMAFDTTDGTLIVYDGSNARVIAHSTFTYNVTISSGPGWGSQTIPIGVLARDMATKITEIKAVTLPTATTVQFQIHERAFSTMNTSTGAAVMSTVYFSTGNNQGNTYTTFNDNSIAANGELVLTTPADGASAGSPAWLKLSITYYKEVE